MGQVQDVTVPDIGDFKDVEIIEIAVSAGDQVNAEDPLITLESDKASMEVPSPVSGTVVELKVAVGDRVSEGTLIASVEVGEASVPEPPSPEGHQESDQGPREEEKPEPKPEAAAAAPKEAQAKRGPTAPAAPEAAADVEPEPAEARRYESADAGPPIDEGRFAKAHASPSIRRFARELGADLGRIEGSGPKGRILKEDVQAFVKGALAKPQETPAPAAAAPAGGGLAIPEMPEIDFSQFGPTETRPLSKIKRLSGAGLHRNWVTIPHVTHQEEADITELEAFRKELGEEAKAQGVRLTMISFLLKAAVAALRKFPEFNASLDKSKENLILKSYFHVGVAVDTPEGLVVPVIRDVDRKGIFELARELGEVSEKARARKLKAEALQGGCFTISSLGGIGGVGFTPIINAPEVAILGVTRSRMQPVYRGGEFVPRLILPLSLSYDHRVIDGAGAARFAAYLAFILGDVRRLVL
jgi:pyruvate dehydrogenase E2 component (dihydrolipoamide acetyltransferase)